MLKAATPAAGPARASAWLLLTLSVALAAAFFGSAFDWAVSTHEDYAIPPDEAEELVSAGNSIRKLSYAVIALVGLALLILPKRPSSRRATSPRTPRSSRDRATDRARRLSSLPGLLLIVYVLVCAASVLWSDEPFLSIKRTGILLFCLVGVLGVVKHLHPRDLINLTLAIGFMFITVGVFAELTQSSFRPWSGEYRFAGTVHPNTQAAHCTLMVLAAFFGTRSVRRGRVVYMALFCVALTFLVLTKSRSCLAGCLIGLSAAWYAGSARPTKVLLLIGAPFAACLALLITLLMGAEIGRTLDASIQMGRGSDAGLSTMNGRGPLWASLLRDFNERPLLGYGYHGFWTAERIFEVSLEQEWTVPTAHSAYIDSLLGTGFVGTSLLGLALLIAFRRAYVRCRDTREPTDCFLLSLLTCAFASSVFESGYLQPTSFDSFIVACALLYVLPRPQSGETQRIRQRPPIHQRWEAVVCR